MSTTTKAAQPNRAVTFTPVDARDSTIDALWAVNKELLEALERAEPALWIVASSGNQDAIEIHAEVLAAITKARGAR